MKIYTTLQNANVFILKEFKNQLRRWINGTKFKDGLMERFLSKNVFNTQFINHSCVQYMVKYKKMPLSVLNGLKTQFCGVKLLKV